MVDEKPRGRQRSVTQVDIEVGQRIRLRRVEQRMSQTELGQALGLSFQQIQKYEKGVNRVGAARLEQIADTLDAPVTFFYGNSASKTKAGNKHRREIESLLFLDSEHSLRVLRAYSAIKDRAVQLHFVSLMEHVAGIAGDK